MQRVNKYTVDISNLNQLVGILTFINKIKTTVVSFKPEISLFFSIVIFMSH